VTGDDLLARSIEALETTRDRFAKAYEDEGPPPAVMNVAAGQGTLAKVIAFATAPGSAPENRF
jgi:hypothetical protein